MGEPLAFSSYDWHRMLKQSSAVLLRCAEDSYMQGGPHLLPRLYSPVGRGGIGRWGVSQTGQCVVDAFLVIGQKLKEEGWLNGSLLLFK